MAERDDTPSNLFYLAAATPAVSGTGNQQWDNAFNRYMAADALARADDEFGANWHAQVEFQRAEIEVNGTYGKAYRNVPEAEAIMDAAWEKLDAADRIRDKKYLGRLAPAAMALALIPAPTMAAALFKIEVIKREELYLYRQMPRDPFELVEEDMNRLSVFTS